MIAITATLNDRCPPDFRGALFEDPLQQVLESTGLGTVEGGGSLLSPNGEITSCDVAVMLKDTSEKALELIIKVLNSRGAPKGSVLRCGGGQDLQFGVTEGIGIYLNGTDLPPEVYAQSDVNEVIEEFRRLLGKNGAMHGYWEGGRETAIYFYGPSFETMKAALSAFIGSHPLCQRARVERVA